MVSERGLEVLRVIVQDYVASREPVGSKSIVDRHAFGVSAATIRNDMALLEEEQLITAPHTSSGRVPTDKGYRLFVDHLAEIRPLTPAQRQAIETFLGESPTSTTCSSRTVRLLSPADPPGGARAVPVAVARPGPARRARAGSATRRLLVVLITDAGRVEQRVVETAARLDEPRSASSAPAQRAAVGVAVEASAALRAIAGAVRPSAQTLVGRRRGDAHRAGRRQPAGALVMAGAANLVRTEKDFPGSILPVLEAIEEQVVLLRLFSEMRGSTSAASPCASGARTPRSASARRRILASGYSAAGARSPAGRARADANGLLQQHRRGARRRPVPLEAPRASD